MCFWVRYPADTAVSCNPQLGTSIAADTQILPVVLFPGPRPSLSSLPTSGLRVNIISPNRINFFSHQSIHTTWPTNKYLIRIIEAPLSGFITELNASRSENQATAKCLSTMFRETGWRASMIIKDQIFYYHRSSSTLILTAIN